jgi:hypothetical protein
VSATPASNYNFKGLSNVSIPLTDPLSLSQGSSQLDLAAVKALFQMLQLVLPYLQVGANRLAASPRQMVSASLWTCYREFVRRFLLLPIEPLKRSL